MFNPRLFYEQGLLKRKLFVSTWDTRNTSTGSSASNQIKIPMISANFSPFTIDWGDGSSDYITAFNSASLTHTYSVSGIYTVTFEGKAYFTYFNNTGDKLKLLEIKRWGNFRIVGSVFYGCTNLDLSNVSDLPNLKMPNEFGVGALSNTLSAAFRATTFTIINRLEEWDVSELVDMSGAFYGASFNQSLGTWNFNKDVVVTNIFFGKTFSNYSASNYDAFLNKLFSRVVGTGRTQTTKQIGAGTIKRTAAGSTARAGLIADGWTINDGGI